MLHDDTDTIRDGAAERRMAAIERLRRAVARLETENRDLLTEVDEFKTVINGLGEGVGSLEDAVDDYRLTMSGIRVSALRRASQRLGETADNWLDRFTDAADGASDTKVKTAA
jgi:exonuclease VII small subunit